MRASPPAEQPPHGVRRGRAQALDAHILRRATRCRGRPRRSNSRGGDGRVHARQRLRLVSPQETTVPVGCESSPARIGCRDQPARGERAMCGIVGLFAKSPAIEDRLGEHLAAMLRQMNDRGPDSAGVAVYRDPVAHGHSKLVLCTPRARRGLGRRRPICVGATGGPAVRHNHALFTLPCAPADAQARAEEHRPDLRVMSAGEVIEIYKETGRPERFAELFALGDVRGTPRDRPHAHGDREPGHDRGLASVLDRPGPLPRAQRLALEPQPPAPRSCAARASASSARTTPRSPPATWRGACARARACTRRSRAASTTSTASTRSRSARATASRSCATRSRASRP